MRGCDRVLRCGRCCFAGNSVVEKGVALPLCRRGDGIGSEGEHGPLAVVAVWGV